MQHWLFGMHVPPQFLYPVEHTQLPALQVSFEPQLMLHAPQFDSSVLMFTSQPLPSLPSQLRLFDWLHVQSPLLHVWSPAHA